MTTPEEFFALVDRHLTGPMRAAGYDRIGEYDEVAAGSRGTPLRLLSRWPWSRRRRRTPKEHVLKVGYEGGDDDEKWVAYYPDTLELDVLGWRELLSGYADWDVWDDLAVPTAEELERRLRVVTAAVMRGPVD